MKKTISRQQLSKKLRQIRKQIKSQIIKKKPYDPRYFREIKLTDDYFLGKPTKRVLIALRSRGCRFGQSKEGPCNICGMLGDNLWNEKINNKEIVRQFNKDFQGTDFKKNPILCVYSNGSFLDEKEIGIKARAEILKLINSKEDIKKVIFESRPEFVNQTKIKELRKSIQGKKIEIGLGFDAENDYTRNILINKQITKESFTKALKILNQNNIGPLVYVVLKPPFLNEKQAIREAIRTINYVFKKGAKKVSLEPVTIQDFTVTDYLFNRNLFKPVWLWSIIEVLRTTHKKGIIVVGGLVFSPLPKNFARNCNQCNKKVMEAINQFNVGQNIKVFNKLRCTCREKWEKEL